MHAAGGLSFFSDASIASVSLRLPSMTYPRPRAVFLARRRRGWRTKRLTLVANYGSLSHTALPLPGYYFGDLKGPFAELRYKLGRSLELFGSTLRSTNNLEKNPSLPDLSTYNITLGANATLPGKVSISRQCIEATVSRKYKRPTHRRIKLKKTASFCCR